MKTYDLTEGSIPKKLFFLSVPIMGVMFMHCAFNIVDMFWLGKLGPESVAAVGSAGFYPWLAQAFILLAKVGGEIRVSQSIGEKNDEKAKKYIKSSLELCIIHGIIYSIIIIAFSRNLMELLNIKNEYVNYNGSIYLKTIGATMLLFFINPMLSSIFNAMGNSKTPFKIVTLGIVTNIILDPILIFGWFGLPKMGVFGAGLATSISIGLETVLYIITILYNRNKYFKVDYFRCLNFRIYREIYKLGMPVCMQSGLFTIISICIAIIVARFGPKAIAAQEIGIQIESISFMTAEGISTAMVSFVGQNVGSRNAERIFKGVKLGISFAIFWGVFSMMVMIFLGTNIFSLFINDEQSIAIGTSYLIIFGLNQPFNCSEIISNGIFKGVGRTTYPSFVSISCNLLRIPLALILVDTFMGINGIWLAMGISSALKGIFMLVALYIRCKNKTLYPGVEVDI